jgi:N-acetylglucosamine-6-phosphate deacetylase
MLALIGARLFTGEAMLDGFALVLEGERIVDLVPDGNIPAGAAVVRCPQGSILAPGFIDAQANGAGGVLFNDEPTEAAVLAIAKALRRSGGTGLLPTLITDDRAKMAKAAEAVIAASRHPGSGILGIHFEGPFISSNRPGVHNPRYIRPLDEEDIAFLTGLPERLPQGRVLLTIAPEEVEDGVIARLASSGIVISAGHTVASFERTCSAIGQGLRGFTHLFNAMPPISSRQPSVTTAALTGGDTWCGIIVDGIHVHPAVLKMALAAKGPDRFFLVTDAMPPVGTDATGFELYGQRILRRDGRLVTEDGTLAGADIDMASAVRNCVHMLGLPLEESLAMASLRPAEFLRLDDRFGRLAPGYRADLVLLDQDLEVLGTWVGGRSATGTP